MTLRDYRLADNLRASGGTVFLSGTQALIRLLLMQAARDARRGLATRGFLSGYRGSPLGMVDQAAWQAAPLLEERGIRFLPAVNEELAATAVLGTQRVEADPERTADGVFALWYGKGPGVDRAGDALKHGNAYGSSPHGGVLVVAGDDHGCVSSSMPHQSDGAFLAWQMPIVAPANVAEYLEFGLYGWELSRFSGNWVGFTALSEVVESSATVDLDATLARVAVWQDRASVEALTGYLRPAGGLHNRWPDLPSLQIEERLQAKLDAVRAFARINPIDRAIVDVPRARVGIVTCGKAHHDLLEVFRRLQITLPALAVAGVRVYKVGLAFPVEPTRLLAFADGLEEILVIEEKAGIVEAQLRELFYNRPSRPAIVGKHDANGAPLVSAQGELRPSKLIEPVADWLARRFPRLDRRDRVVDFTVPQLLANAGDAVKRLPYFCAGCPHNTSTRVPAGSQAQAGIGCHFMASWMDRDTAGLIQMGGEGVDWVSHAQFTKRPHVFQNLGDGTYFHSGYLALRQAIAANANITYKILYNDAVAMTGGQPIDGTLTVDAIARQVEAEGAKRVVVVSDAIEKYAALRRRFPPGTEFHDRAELDAVQRRLREIPGVTVLIYEQTCAAEKRRRRKKGELATPGRRLFINQAVCEGCGDCSVQSNCIAVLPVETEFGRKRRIDQSSCNQDYSCANGFCPSFVGVLGATPKRRVGAWVGPGGARLAALVDGLEIPPPRHWSGPYDLLVTGVGGTGVVTVGALVAMAAHLEGKAASVLDFMGFAQKGGAVLAFVRLAEDPSALNQVRIDAQQADAMLACDLVVAASADALQTVRHGRTRVLVNRHGIPVAESLRNPDADLHVDALLEKIEFAAGAERVETLDAQQLAEDFLGDAIVANVIALGYAWQIGLVPLGLAALLRAIELNGVAVETNRMAFGLGRLAAGNAAACRELLHEPDPAKQQAPSLDEIVARAVRHLTGYQDARYAERYQRLVELTRQRETEIDGDPSLPLSRAVATQMRKLMAYKDEYEVARLYTDGTFERQLREQFDGDFRLEFYLAPPALTGVRRATPPALTKASRPESPRKRRFGGWLWPLLRLLAHAKGLRGTPFDPFGHTAERRLERRLIDDYEARIRELLPRLDRQSLPLAVAIADIPHEIRGYGHVKLASLAIARAHEAELLHRLNPQRYPRQAAVAADGLPRSVPVAPA